MIKPIHLNTNANPIHWIMLIMALCPTILMAKLKPSDLTDLIQNSDLIAIVDVYAINARGKSSTGRASATVRTLIRGQTENPDINMSWDGIAIYELGQWLVFLKQNEGQYQATYGARSFWKVESATREDGDCCTPFAVLRSPVSELTIDASLVSEQHVYINGVPRESNPIKAKGIKIEQLKTYIRKINNLN